MKRIDSNLFIGPCPIRALESENGPGGLQKRVGANHGIFTSFSALFHKDWDAGLIHDTRWWPCAGSSLHGMTNPSFAGWYRDFLRHRKRLPIVSVKVYPDLHGYDIRHLREAAKLALDQNLPLVYMRRLVDDRLVPSWWRPRPGHMAKVLRVLQRLDVPALILSNFQAHEIDEMRAGDVAPFWRYEVGTFTPFSFWLSSFSNDDLGSRLIFGSGAPLYYAAGAMSVEKSGISKEAIARILSGNARATYGL